MGQKTSKVVTLIFAQTLSQRSSKIKELWPKDWEIERNEPVDRKRIILYNAPIYVVCEYVTELAVLS